MKTFSLPRRYEAEISLTPLIDILLTVLMFFVMTATFADRLFLQVALPRAMTGRLETNDSNAVRVGTDADGNVFLEG